MSAKRLGTRDVTLHHDARSSCNFCLAVSYKALSTSDRLLVFSVTGKPSTEGLHGLRPTNDELQAVGSDHRNSLHPIQATCPVGKTRFRLLKSFTWNALQAMSPIPSEAAPSGDDWPKMQWGFSYQASVRVNDLV